MDRLIETATTFPTAIWTVLLGVALLYWLASLLGMADDALHLHHGGHAEMHADGHEMGDFAAKLMALGLGSVPFSIVITLISLYGWLFSALAHQYLLWLPTVLHYALGAVLLLVSFALALPATAITLRPLRGLFVTHNAVSKAVLVGSVCRISTQSVDEKFGRAEVASGGAPFNIRIAASSPNTLARGHHALITDYDASRDVYTVVAVDEGDR
ncbi:hypothetical protein IGB42_01559 [Andreprevotia sp. IGB-42]|uniref:OB-fold-containig protein n=1 Tax=Andreprevotia sp. IGB-42 TaxID=2497473 RepID=UPI001358DDF1|nr:OB-fold-containig protein [Andreprevotia sp. IGB-42]KAF0813880.1 hypothetical protein IGB42_01559 [Andreprevotia sp. IGB-42]